MFPHFAPCFWPVKLVGYLGRNQTIFNTRKTPVSSVRARGVFGAVGRRGPLELALLNKVREPGRGEAPGHGQGFGLACARGVLGSAGQKDQSRLPYLKEGK